MTSSRHRPSRRYRRAQWWPALDTTRHGDAREQARRLLARARIDELVHGDTENPTDRRTC